MRTTTYKCDRCGAEDQDNRTLYLEQVGVHVGGYARYASFGEKPKAQYNQEWCVKCRVQTGLSDPNHDKTTTPAPDPITLEQLVRDIAYEAASDAIANRG